jgi:hypothetical protein
MGDPGPVPAGPEGLWLEAFLEAPSGFRKTLAGLQGRLAAPACGVGQSRQLVPPARPLT